MCVFGVFVNLRFFQEVNEENSELKEENEKLKEENEELKRKSDDASQVILILNYLPRVFAQN